MVCGAPVGEQERVVLVGLFVCRHVVGRLEYRAAVRLQRSMVLAFGCRAGQKVVTPVAG
jgi:hypothetical protein